MIYCGSGSKKLSGTFRPGSVPIGRSGTGNFGMGRISAMGTLRRHRITISPRSTLSRYCERWAVPSSALRRTSPTASESIVRGADSAARYRRRKTTRTVPPRRRRTPLFPAPDSAARRTGAPDEDPTQPSRAELMRERSLHQLTPPSLQPSPPPPPDPPPIRMHRRLAFLVLPLPIP